MPIQPPPEVISVLSTLDSSDQKLDVMDVEQAIRDAVKDRASLATDAARGAWAEQAAFALSTHETPTGGPWGTYFQPLMTSICADGKLVCYPELREADQEVLKFWGQRATSVRHPILAARYADLVWDVTKFVIGGKPDIKFARLAIDSYLAAARLDDGSGWGDTHINLGRALQLAMSVGDAPRITETTKATISYAERAAQEDKVGTYCCLFDNLLPSKGGPELDDADERTIVAIFEARFSERTTPGQWDVDPHGTEEIGNRLASYYRRKGKPEERSRILAEVARAFERRAKLGEALGRLMFLEKAREVFVEAGLHGDAERVQREAQLAGPDAEKQLAHLEVKHETPKAEVDEFLAQIMDGGVEKAIVRFAVDFIPDQEQLAEQIEEIAKASPLYPMLGSAPKVLGHGHIVADVADDAGDPDGKMVHQTKWHINLGAQWLAWTLDHMARNGLTADRILDFIRACPLFGDDRLPLIRRGLEAHFLGDYVQSVHLLIPQIEAAVVRLPPLVGKPSNKAHRSGRGVMQFKNLNDVLERGQWSVPGRTGKNLRMYLLAAMAHPKGINLRNEVCHGLRSAGQFTKTVSELVVHVLVALALLQPAKPSGEAMLA
jgi:lysyl-tRNA synthetase class 1